MPLRVKLLSLGLAAILCLLLGGTFFDHTYSWYTGAAYISTLITADATSYDWVVDYSLNGDLGLVQTGSTANKTIGTITARAPNLTVSYVVVPPPDLNPAAGIYDINDLRYTDLITPVSPFTLVNVGDTATLVIQVKVLGNNPLGLYKGQLQLSFSDPLIEPLVIPIQVQVVKKI